MFRDWRFPTWIGLLCLLAPSLAGCSAAAPPEPENLVALDLIEDFGRARVPQPVSRIELGELERERVLLGGFERRLASGNALRSRGSSVAISFEIASPRDTNLRLRARASRRLDLEAFLNGTRFATFELVTTYSIRTLSAPAELWLPGDNRLRFQVVEEVETEDRLDWAWLELENAHETSGAPVELQPDPAGGRRLVIPRGRRVSYDLRLLPGARLELGGLRAAGTVGSLGIVLTTDGEDGPVEATRSAVTLGGRPTRHRIELPVSAPTVGRLTLFASAIADTVAEPTAAESAVLIDDAVVTTPDTTGRDRASPVTTPAPSIVVFLVDTLRADRLGAYGYGRPTSPRIDEFASSHALVFENATAQSSWTKPTVASMLTGLHPASHGAYSLDRVLADEVVTVPERLAEAGYATGAMVTITPVSSTFGFDQGFDTFEERLEDSDRPGLHLPAAEVVDWALEWVRGARTAGRPFFLYLHVSDVHSPYAPPEPHRSAFASEGEVLDPYRLPGLSRAEQERLRPIASDLYDAEIAYMDEQFGRFVGGLERMELLDEVALLLVADHGEEFLDHGGWTHGRTLYEEQLHVPLILKLPDGEHAGRRIGSRVTQMDVAPTLIELAGLAPAPETLHGSSLLPLLEREEAGRAAPAHLRHRSVEMDSLTLDGVKLVVGERASLFDLGTDPDERVDLVPGRPITGAYLFGALQRLQERYLRAALPIEESTLPPDVEARLRALGYIR